MNIAYAVSAYPAGAASDRIGRGRVMLGGVVLLIVADRLLASGGSLRSVFVGTIVWGLHLGLTQGLLATLVADTAPADLRGTAFGVFNLAGGIATLLASVIAGAAVGRYRPGEHVPYRGGLRGACALRLCASSAGGRRDGTAG